MSPKKLIFEHIGTPAYLPPEIIKEKGYSGFKADIWSLGITVYICITGKVPFRGDTIDELHQNILSHKIDISQEKEFSPIMTHLLKKMLVKNPKKRISAI